MRELLKKLGSEKRHTFTALVGRFGTKTNWHGYPETTLCLNDVTLKDTKVVMTDHLWFTERKAWKKLGLQVGDYVQFDARVGEYTKGYWCDREWDYKLTRPTNIQILKRANTKETALQTSAIEGGESND